MNTNNVENKYKKDKSKNSKRKKLEFKKFRDQQSSLEPKIQSLDSNIEFNLTQKEFN